MRKLASVVCHKCYGRIILQSSRGGQRAVLIRLVDAFRQLLEDVQVREADELSSEPDDTCAGEALEAPRDMNANRAQE